MVGYIMLGALLLLCVIDIRPSHFTISKDTTVLMKGIGAALVFFHHLTSAAGGGILNKMNFPAVSIFFLAAGYGVMFSYLNRGTDYLNKIIYKKIPTIFLWCLFSVLMTSMYWLLIDCSLGWKEVLLCFTGNRILNWFFTALVIKYIIFVVLAYLFRDNHAHLVLCAFAVTGVYMFACRAIPMGASWYCSSLAFPTGILLSYILKSEQNRKLLSLLRNSYKRNILVVILVILFLSSFAGVYIEINSVINRIIHLGFQLLSAELFALFIFAFCVGKKGKGILLYCGKFSGPILLVQNITLTVGHNRLFFIENDLLYAFFTILVQMLFVAITIPIYQWIQRKVQRK